MNEHRRLMFRTASVVLMIIGFVGAGQSSDDLIGDTEGEAGIRVAIERFDRWVFGGQHDAFVIHSAERKISIYIGRYFQPDQELANTLPSVDVLRSLAFASRYLLQVDQESTANVRIYMVEELSDGVEIVAREPNLKLQASFIRDLKSRPGDTCVAHSQVQDHLVFETIAFVLVPRGEVDRRFHSERTAACIIRAVWKHMGVRNIAAVPDSEVVGSGRYSESLEYLRPDPRGRFVTAATNQALGVAFLLYQSGLKPGMNRHDALIKLRERYDER